MITPKIMIGFRLEEKYAKQLKEVADKYEKGVSEVCRMIIKIYLENRK